MFKSPRNGLSLREHRLIWHYNWNTERLAKESGAYVEGISNPVDGVLHVGAGAVHVVTGIGDAVLGDIVRLVQGEKNRVPLAAYSGSIPRLKLDVAEAGHAVGNVFRGKIASVLALPIIALKATGDAVADGVDLLAGVKHGGAYSLSA